MITDRNQFDVATVMALLNEQRGSVDAVDPIETDGSPPEGEGIAFGGAGLDDELVKAYLDEILLVLILAHGGACGQDLIRDLYRMGCSLSPGTVYPHLHDLDDEGVLKMHKKRQTKQFRVEDRQKIEARIRAAAANLGTLRSIFVAFDRQAADADDGSTDLS